MRWISIWSSINFEEILLDWRLEQIVLNHFQQERKLSIVKFTLIEANQFEKKNLQIAHSPSFRLSKAWLANWLV